MAPSLCQRSFTFPPPCLNSLIQIGTKIIGQLFPLSSSSYFIYDTSSVSKDISELFSCGEASNRRKQLNSEAGGGAEKGYDYEFLWFCLEGQQRTGFPNPGGPFHTYFLTIHLNQLPKRPLRCFLYCVPFEHSTQKHPKNDLCRGTQMKTSPTSIDVNSINFCNSQQCLPVQQDKIE